MTLLPPCVDDLFALSMPRAGTSVNGTDEEAHGADHMSKRCGFGWFFNALSGVSLMGQRQGQNAHPFLQCVNPEARPLFFRAFFGNSFWNWLIGDLGFQVLSHGHFFAHRCTKVAIAGFFLTMPSFFPIIVTVKVIIFIPPLVVDTPLSLTPPLSMTHT